MPYEITKELASNLIGFKASMDIKKSDFDEYTVILTLKDVSSEGLERLGIKGID